VVTPHHCRASGAYFYSGAGMRMADVVIGIAMAAGARLTLR
jgi:hypothetical protein